MSRVRTHCPSCRQYLDLPAGRCAVLGGVDGRPKVYAFVCPRCEAPVIQLAEVQATAKPGAGGPLPGGAHGPAARPAHPERPRPGPPLTADDLIDFHFLLDGADWFPQLTAPAAAGGLAAGARPHASDDGTADPRGGGHG